MKWVNHQVVTGVILYAVTEDLLLTACGMAGAILPDKVEGNPRGGLLSLGWRSRHRGWSHWPLIYLALMGLLLEWQGIPLLAEAPLGELMAEGHPVMAGLALCAGALLHILEDAVCGKVPVFTPDHKYGIRLFSVGSLREYIFSMVAVLFCYVLKAWS